MVPPRYPSDDPPPGDGSRAATLRRLDEELRFADFTGATRRTYRGHVRRFLRWVGEEADLPPDESAVRRYLLHLLEERGLSHSHVNQCSCALKFFYGRMHPGVVDAATFPRLPRRKTLPEVLSRGEVAALLTSVESPRYRAILMLIYSAGLRTGEAIRMRPEDLAPDRGLLHVRQGKGRKDRVVMLSTVALKAIRSYRELESSSRWLFPGARPGRHISADSVQRAFAIARSAAGIEKDVTPHSLRHSFATHLLESGTHIRHIQALLGHASIDSTQIYTRVAGRELAAIPNPLDTLEDGETG